MKMEVDLLNAFLFFSTFGYNDKKKQGFLDLKEIKESEGGSGSKEVCGWS